MRIKRIASYISIFSLFISAFLSFSPVADAAFSQFYTGTISACQVPLNWAKAPVGGPGTYTITRTAASSANPVTIRTNVPSTTTTITDITNPSDYMGGNGSYSFRAGNNAETFTYQIEYIVSGNPQESSTINNVKLISFKPISSAPPKVKAEVIGVSGVSATINLNWTDVALPDAANDGYEIVRSTNGGGEIVAGLVFGNTTAFTDIINDFSTANTYTYRVRAFSSDPGCGVNGAKLASLIADPSQIQAVFSPFSASVTLPYQPSIKTATSGSNSITIDWSTSSIANANGFEVWTKKDSDFSGENNCSSYTSGNVVCTKFSSSTTSTTFSSLVPNSTYYVRVRTTKSNTSSNVSCDDTAAIACSPFSTAPFSVTTGMTDPSNLFGSFNWNGSATAVDVRLSFNTNGSSYTYKIERSEDDSFPAAATQTLTIPLGGISGCHTDDCVFPSTYPPTLIGHIYYYRLHGESGATRTGSITAVVDLRIGRVTGYMWSNSIGWISLNCDQSGSGGSNTCGTSTYGVYDDIRGNLTGYAWSDNIGWIKFGGLSSFPSGGALSDNAKITNNLTRIKGWARACAGTSTGTCGTMTSRDDGWDGWISFSSNANPTYSVNLAAQDPTSHIAAASGYAWGSNVVGWISVNRGTQPMLVEIPQAKFDLKGTGTSGNTISEANTNGVSSTTSSSATISVDSGSPINISWSTLGLQDTCTATGNGWPAGTTTQTSTPDGDYDTTGHSATFYASYDPIDALQNTRTFTLACIPLNNPSTTLTRTVIVSINPTNITFSSDKNYDALGALGAGGVPGYPPGPTLTWTTATGATTTSLKDCVASNDGGDASWSGPLVNSGSKVVQPTVDTIYTLSCSDFNGQSPVSPATIQISIMKNRLTLTDLDDPTNVAVSDPDTSIGEKGTLTIDSGHRISAKWTLSNVDSCTSANTLGNTFWAGTEPAGDGDHTSNLGAFLNMSNAVQTGQLSLDCGHTMAGGVYYPAPLAKVLVNVNPQASAALFVSQTSSNGTVLKRNPPNETENLNSGTSITINSGDYAQIDWVTANVKNPSCSVSATKQIGTGTPTAYYYTPSPANAGTLSLTNPPSKPDVTDGDHPKFLQRFLNSSPINNDTYVYKFSGCIDKIKNTPIDDTTATIIVVREQPSMVVSSTETDSSQTPVTPLNNDQDIFVATGSYARLEWTSKDIASCTISGPNTDGVGTWTHTPAAQVQPNGSYIYAFTTPFTNTDIANDRYNTYTFNCLSVGGAPITTESTILVTAAPTLSLMAVNTTGTPNVVESQTSAETPSMTIQNGTVTKLSWGSNQNYCATGMSASSPWNSPGSRPSSGLDELVTLYYPASATTATYDYVFTMACDSTDAAAKGSSPATGGRQVIVKVSRPTLTLTVTSGGSSKTAPTNGSNPSITVVHGTAVNLSWSSNQTACWTNDLWKNASPYGKHQNSTGSETTDPLTWNGGNNGKYVFVLACDVDDNTAKGAPPIAVSQQVTVHVLPPPGTITLNAVEYSGGDETSNTGTVITINSGSSAGLRWSANGIKASSCSASGTNPNGSAWTLTPQVTPDGSYPYLFGSAFTNNTNADITNTYTFSGCQKLDSTPISVPPVTITVKKAPTLTLTVESSENLASSTSIQIPHGTNALLKWSSNENYCKSIEAYWPGTNPRPTASPAGGLDTGNLFYSGTAPTKDYTFELDCGPSASSTPTAKLVTVKVQPANAADISTLSTETNPSGVALSGAQANSGPIIYVTQDVSGSSYAKIGWTSAFIQSCTITRTTPSGTTSNYQNQMSPAPSFTDGPHEYYLGELTTLGDYTYAFSCTAKTGSVPTNVTSSTTVKVSSQSSLSLLATKASSAAGHSPIAGSSAGLITIESGDWARLDWGATSITNPSCSASLTKNGASATLPSGFPNNPQAQNGDGTIKVSDGWFASGAWQFTNTSNIQDIYEYTFSGCTAQPGTGTLSAPAPVKIKVNPAPTLTFTADQLPGIPPSQASIRISGNTSAALTWTTNQMYCLTSASWLGGTQTKTNSNPTNLVWSKSETTGTLTNSTSADKAFIYTLLCDNNQANLTPANAAIQKTVTVNVAPGATISLTSSATNIDQGQTADLVWWADKVDYNSCQGRSDILDSDSNPNNNWDWHGDADSYHASKPPSTTPGPGGMTVRPTVTTTYTLACNDTAGTPVPVQSVKVTAKPIFPTVMVEKNKSVVNLEDINDKVTLHWWASDLDQSKCFATNNANPIDPEWSWSNPSNQTSQTYPPGWGGPAYSRNTDIPSTVTYKVSCDNPLSDDPADRVEQTATINFLDHESNADLFLTASPSSLALGQSSTLTWNTRSVGNCSIASSDGSWPHDENDSIPVDGSESVTPKDTGTVTYTLKCYDPLHPNEPLLTTTNITVSGVVNPDEPNLFLNIGQSSVVPDENDQYFTTLSWSTTSETDYSSCTLTSNVPSSQTFNNSDTNSKVLNSTNGYTKTSDPIEITQDPQTFSFSCITEADGTRIDSQPLSVSVVKAKPSASVTLNAVPRWFKVAPGASENVGKVRMTWTVKNASSCKAEHTGNATVTGWDNPSLSSQDIQDGQHFVDINVTGTSPKSAKMTLSCVGKYDSQTVSDYDDVYISNTPPAPKVKVTPGFIEL
ncbi:MAG: hypothetical protein WC795_01495 [Candidatus Paceibacterota bacterium]|jgi:hypothetical protein